MPRDTGGCRAASFTCPRLLLAAYAVLSVAASGTAEARETVLEPDGPWAIDYAEQKCRLARFFGMGEDRSILLFEQCEPREVADLTAAGAPLRRLAVSPTLKVLVGPGDTQVWQRTGRGRTKLEGYGPAVWTSFTAPSTWISRSSPAGVGEESDAAASTGSPQAREGLPHIRAEEFTGTDRLTLEGPKDRVTFLVGGLSAALAALNNCAVDLLASWDLDPEKQKTITAKARPLNLDEIREGMQKGYPVEAARRGERGYFSLRIIVNEDGTIGDCALTNATSVEYLRSNACEVFGDRAMFAPAQDASGNPIKSFYTTTVAYH